MVKKIRRKVKKIAMKASLVNMDLEDISEENKRQKETLAKDFSEEFEFVSWKKQQVEKQAGSANIGPTIGEGDIPSSNAHDAPDEIKKVYRSIAQATHPDKTQDEYLNGIFRKAAEAMECENWMLIIELAGELRLDIDFLSDETCLQIEESIKRNEQEINNIKNSFSYIWDKQKTDKDREMFKALFYKQFKINPDEFENWRLHFKGPSS